MDKELNNCSDSFEEPQSREELLNHLAHCLKNSRQNQKLNLEEVAVSLKLRMSYLEALESGQWDDMPGEVYALGFLKQYAAYLGVDISGSIEKLKTGDYKLTKPLTFPDPPIAPNRTWVIVAALAFVILFILFNIFDSGEPEHHVTAPEEPTEMQLAPDIAVPESYPGVENGEAAIEEPPADESTAEIVTDEAVEHEYRLSAIDGDVWLQITTDPSDDTAGELLQEALLKSGESIEIRNTDSLLLTCGNAAALQIEIDGIMTATAGSLGDEGKVLRNFRLASE